MSETGAMNIVVPRPPRLRVVSGTDVMSALRGAMADLLHAPAVALGFGVLIALAGVVAVLCITQFDAVWLAITIGIAFPLGFPFLTAGLYETSRLRMTGGRVSAGAIWAAMWLQRERQMGWMAFVVLFIFWIWIYQVRLLLALFMGTGASSDLGLMLLHIATTPSGWGFLVVGSLVGLALALVLFSSTVIALPLLFEHDVDFVTALIVSWRTVMRNRAVMLALGVMLTVVTLLAALPAFAGLVVVFPLFGFMTWRLYDLVRVRGETESPL